jgi:prophage regulatory protein
MQRRILRVPDVERATGLSRPHLDRLEKAGAFPKRVRLVPNSGPRGAVGWYEDEIEAWVDARPRVCDLEKVPA